MKYLLYVETDDIHSLVDFINIQDFCYQIEELNNEDPQLELDFNQSTSAMPSMSIE